MGLHISLLEEFQGRWLAHIVTDHTYYAQVAIVQAISLQLYPSQHRIRLANSGYHRCNTLSTAVLYAERGWSQNFDVVIMHVPGCWFRERRTTNNTWHPQAGRQGPAYRSLFHLPLYVGWSWKSKT